MVGRILIIDDDEQVLLTLSEVVEGLGHQVRTAGNGRIGIELFEREPFDCVITDLAMPEIDGLGVLRRVKAASPETGVLVITGNSTVDLLAASVNMGVDSYVTKPFKIRELDEQLSRIFERREKATDGHLSDPASSPARRALGARIPLGWAIALSGGVALVVHLVGRLI